MITKFFAKFFQELVKFLAWITVTASVVLSAIYIISGKAEAADWNHPGSNPFVLPLPAAVDSYPEIPQGVKQRLKDQMEKRKYSDVIRISKAKIVGAAGREYTNLRDMHWGYNPLPHRGAVIRSAWTDQDEQRAFVYCVDSWCIAVPFVCRNVALIDLVQELEKDPPLVSEPPVVISEPPGESFMETSEPDVVDQTSYSYWYVPTFIAVPGLVNQTTVSIAAPVPEPETLVLVAVALVGCWFRLRKIVTL